jgi:alkanesulfonate monooxygenase SsuD/methylene tetrahydromethanopterin reductase-like flavin-dependent oxidoreductase (luciferase family)
MAWVLARTQNIHVASGIINITPPVNHPARVAERVAMMDLVSGGRFEFGTGRGSSTTEMGGFGITDPEITREMYDESLREIVRMWRDEPYSYDGKFFSMPERNVLPKPYVKPHPPLWVAAGNPETFERAAKLGIGVICFTGGTPEKMAPLVETYKKHIKDADPVGAYVNDNIAITTSFMCLEDREEAIDWVTKSGNGYQQTLLFKYLDTFPKPPFVPDWPTEIPDPTREQVLAGRESGASIVGNPEDCAAALRKWDAIGVDQLIMGPSGSTYSNELMQHTVELFGNQVIPEFDTTPEHSTSRYRAAAAARLAGV